MRNKINLIRQLRTHFGTGWLIYRAGYAARLRSGLLRRQLPITAWDEHSFSNLLKGPRLTDPAEYLRYRRTKAPAFFFSSADLDSFRPKLLQHDTLTNSPIQTADALHSGTFTYFSQTSIHVGSPPQWHHHPFTQQTLPTAAHWSQLNDFGFGDIKQIWEPSRFGWVYPLVRAYWRTGDERYAELFWAWTEDWITHNRPNQGANWKCGQESSLRVMALCFGMYGFLHSPSTSGIRLLRLMRLMAFSAERILGNLSYGVSQRNNHGISEGMGLWTIGLLFPELRGADMWRARGRDVLEAEAQTLIYNDGTFSQNSVNYHRVMLDDFVWALRLGELAGNRFSQATYRKVASACNWLYQLLNIESGGVPYVGQNDGALILPLSNAAYDDFRPIIQAAHYLTGGKRKLPSGQWDEKLLWLFGSDALTGEHTPVKQRDFSAPDGGYYTLRDANSMAFARCGGFRDRPSHADLLHVDLWWRGHNIAQDAGTYSYNAPAPWNNPLAHSGYHNTVTVNGKDQMRRAGKFLWLPWTDGQVTRRTADYWEGTHSGYAADGVAHQRAIVRLGNDSWLVLDRLLGQRPFDARLHWLLADLPHKLHNESSITLATSAGDFYMTVGALTQPTYALVRADADSPRGWRAPFYGYREPALSFSADCHAQQQLFWTLFTPYTNQLTLSDMTLAVTVADKKHHVDLVVADNRPIVSQIKTHHTDSPEMLAS